MEESGGWRLEEWVGSPVAVLYPALSTRNPRRGSVSGGLWLGVEDDL
jgi:hypothetical protein